MVNNNKSMTRNNKSFIFLLAFAMIFLLSNVSATTLDSYGSKKVNEQFTFTQVCSDATYITLSSIETPTGVVYLNVNMSNIGLGQYSYNYTPTEIGRYDFRGISDGCEKTYATYVEVTPDGNTGKLGFYFLILLLSLGVIVLGVSLADPTISLLGSFGLYFIGLYILFYGIDGFKDTVYTWGLGIIVLGLAFYISARSAYALIGDDN
jgi:hypothetical protein